MALAYYRTGTAPFLNPLPLPEGAKQQPPAGFTGEGASRLVTKLDIERWAANGKGRGNIALRITHPYLGIDVDHYGGKRGSDTIAAAEADLGPLPPTLVSTARDPRESGIRWYRLPAAVAAGRRVPPSAERALAAYGHERDGRTVTDVEIVSNSYRYAVVHPSVNPDAGGAVYRWYGDDGAPLPDGAAPGSELIAELPVAWAELLTIEAGAVEARAAHRSGRAKVRAGGALPYLAPLGWEPDGFSAPPSGIRLTSVEDANAEYARRLAAISSSRRPKVNWTVNGECLFLWRLHLSLRDSGADGLHPGLTDERAMREDIRCAALRAWVASGGKDDGDYSGTDGTIDSAFGAVAREPWDAENYRLILDTEDDDGLDLGGDAPAVGSLLVGGAQYLVLAEGERGNVGRPVHTLRDGRRVQAADPRNDPIMDRARSDGEREREDKTERKRAPKPTRVTRQVMDFGDLGLADLVASWLDDRWRWTDAFGWMGHAGTHYVRHLRDTDALEYARTATLKAMGDLIDRLASGEKVEDDERDAIMDLVQDARRFKRVFDLSRGPLSVRAQDFDEGDARRWLNTPAGIIDLDTGETIGHSPEHLVSKCTGAPIGDVVGPVFSRFLAEALPDPQVRDYVQRLLGSHLYGSVREHLLAIFWGAGRNGKGTLRTAVIRALGDYGDELSPELLMTQKYTRHGTFKMRLRGLRSAWCSETEKGRRMSEAEVKNLTGGDPIEANFMHKDPITFDPSHHLILCTNHLPEIAEPDPALWARIRVIGWTESFEGREDHGLAEKLSSSAELAGVMRWLYDGYQEYRRVGLGMDVTPEAVKLATDDYKTETDNYAAFVDTWCERTKGKVTTTSGTTSAAVFAQWSRYCLANGIKDAGSAAAFAKELDRIGVPKVKTKVGAVFGLKVNPPDDAEDDGDGGVDPWS